MRPMRVHPQQPGGDEGIHRNGEGEHLVIVLGQVEAGIGGEHAAEGTQQDGHKAHDGKSKTSSCRPGHAPAHGEGQKGEHPPMIPTMMKTKKMM